MSVCRRSSVHVSSVPVRPWWQSQRKRSRLVTRSALRRQKAVLKQKATSTIESESSSELLTSNEAEDAENWRPCLELCFALDLLPNLGFHLRNENHSSA